MAKKKTTPPTTLVYSATHVVQCDRAGKPQLHYAVTPELHGTVEFKREGSMLGPANLLPATASALAIALTKAAQRSEELQQLLAPNE